MYIWAILNCMPSTIMYLATAYVVGNKHNDAVSATTYDFETAINIFVPADIRIYNLMFMYIFTINFSPFFFTIVSGSGLNPLTPLQKNYVDFLESINETPDRSIILNPQGT